ncbi:MAG: hypothetical protein R3C01_08015 [Planctomycetaceae bacterium]
MTERPTKAELETLSRAACVAYAVRAARRVQPLTRRPEVAEQALALTEKWLSGGNVSRDELRASASSSASSSAAAYAAAAAADDAAATASAASAYDWFASAADAFAYASLLRRDFEVLARVQEVTIPFDPTDKGPLGPLWDGSPPEWFVEAWKKVASKFETLPWSAPQLDESPPPKLSLSPGDRPELQLKLTVPDDASDEEILEAIREYSTNVDLLYRSLGGRGLQFKPVTIMDPALVEVPHG